MSDVPPLLSVVAWSLCLLALSPAVYRLGRRRWRSLDPIWCVMFLLALNRLSFVLKVSQPLSQATAVALALTLAVLATSYQRSDTQVRRGRERS